MAREPIFQGGLLRCCVDTLDRRTEPGVVGEIVRCDYEEGRVSARMILREDGWRWLRPDDEEFDRG